VYSQLFGFKYRPSTHLLVTDEDASDFLQSQFSNDLRPFAAGQVTYGLWLDIKGRVLADSYVLCENDECFHVMSVASEESVIRATLDAHIIADDVILESVGSGFALALYGKDATQALSTLGVKPLVVGHYSIFEGTKIVRGRRSHADSYELFCESEEAVKHLEACLIEVGMELIDQDVLEEERILSGVPRIPYDVGPRDLPGEGGLEHDAISFTKGCFLGQEVIARMHHVGRAQRGLFIIRGEGSVPVFDAPIVTLEGKKVGTIRSAFQEGDSWNAIAMLKIRFSEPGRVVCVGVQTAIVQKQFGV